MTLQQVTVRTARGPLHIAVRTRKGWDTACFRTLTPRTVDVEYVGRDRLGRLRGNVAWAHERQCADCARLLGMGRDHLLAVTGW